MSGRKLRKDDLLDVSILDWQLKTADVYDFSKAQEFPDYEYLYSRFYTILAEKPTDGKDRFQSAIVQVVKEFRGIWITMNVYPMSYTSVHRNVSKLLKDFNSLVTRGEKQKQKQWIKKAKNVCDAMKNGVDILTKDDQARKSIEKVYGVRMTESETNFYIDNCVQVTDETDPYFGKCRRRMWSGDVDKTWLAAAKRRQVRIQMENDRQLRNESAEEAQETQDLSMSSSEEDNNLAENDGDADVVYEIPTGSTCIPDVGGTFAEIPARYSYKELNLDLIEVIAEVECSYEVPANRSRELVAYILNTLCGQNLVVPSEDQEEQEDAEFEEGAPTKKRRKFELDQKLMCSRTTIRKYIKDAGILNLFHAAESIKKSKEEGSVVTVGWDDTLKKGGNRLWDIKTGHVTIVDEQRKRTILSLGFQQNISHSGKDSAESIQSTITKLAKASDLTYEEVLSCFDFHITDRAGDSDVMLDVLGVDDEKRLKCNAHPILAIGQAIDKVFRDVESRVGTEKLISTGASHCFSSPSNSVWYLGLLAASKALSPSHCTESVSLYTQYTNFLNGDVTAGTETSELSGKLIKSGFKGFSSNRFGRIGELSTLMKTHMDTVIRFFNECVDENANKLSLAIAAYVSSEWFKTCVVIGAEFDQLIMVPLKEALGIDQFAEVKSKYRSWNGLKSSFSEKFELLKVMFEENVERGPIERLKSDVANSIHSALTKQLNVMAFYRSDVDVSEETERKMNFTPLTNSGCESQFGDITDTLKKVGGSTSIEKLSDMHTVKKNQLFNTQKWIEMTKEEKRDQWKLARNSDKSKEIRQTGEEFLRKVEGMKQLAQEEKKKKKVKKNERTLKLLQLCKMHGGPITVDEITKLDQLDEKQLLLEVGYLRATIAPNIRQKRKNADGKFEKFTKDELTAQIRNSIQPISDLSADLSTLLSETFKQTVDNDSTTEITEFAVDGIKPGMVAWWRNCVGDRELGVVLDNESVQMYTKRRHGYAPYGLPDTIDRWDLEEEITNYVYVQNKCGIYLQLE